MTSPHDDASITEVSALVRQREVSPAELVAGCLERIEALNPSINAFITVTAELALRGAKRAEAEIAAGNWRGPLHGIPIGIKDMFDTAGLRTTAAHAPFADRVPARDAAAVEALKRAGAIIVGKTNLHEQAAGTTSVISAFGAVHNPWNPDYVAGGSSGGSAAAVASGMCYSTLDTDAVGSCRLPAAICGITGFKGTYGLISNRGVLEGIPADEGILRIAHAAYSVRAASDATILLDVLATPRELAHTSQGHRKKTPGEVVLGVVSNAVASDVVGDVFRAAVATLETLGYTTREIEAPLNPPFSFEEAGTIEQDRATIARSLFSDIDLLLLPTTTDVTPTIHDAEANGPLAVSPANTFFCNYYGSPAVSVPCGFDPEGLPLGLQIAGPPWGDDAVLAVARAYQGATTWHERHPPLESTME